MKLSPRDALGYFAKPDPKKAGLLIYGPDAMRIALRRAEVIKSLIGPNGEDEMRLTRISGSELRKNKALLIDAVMAQGFFPGPRSVLIEDASDQHAEIIKECLFDWREGDGIVIATAGQLKASSKLRKLFENHPAAYATAIYNDPPTRAEIENTLKKAGLDSISRDAMADIEALARALDPGDFSQTVEKISLYCHNNTQPVSREDIAACAPMSTEASIDDLLHVVAEGRVQELAPVLIKLNSQGSDPVALSIFALRHFRALHTAASDPSGAASGISKMRPPIFGPRRDRMLRQAQQWGMYKLEAAISLLTETDLTLRSSSKAPSMAVMERALIRLSMLAQKR